uniref:Uncharacterized protein n=1 Tax=Arundo donax TaxID=35708 RepID=A0A0A9B8H7_ARUDO
MQSDSSMGWHQCSQSSTQVINYDGNHYTTKTSTTTKSIQHLFLVAMQPMMSEKTISANSSKLQQQIG